MVIVPPVAVTYFIPKSATLDSYTKTQPSVESTYTKTTDALIVSIVEFFSKPCILLEFLPNVKALVAKVAV